MKVLSSLVVLLFHRTTIYRREFTQERDIVSSGTSSLDTRVSRRDRQNIQSKQSEEVIFLNIEINQTCKIKLLRSKFNFGVWYFYVISQILFFYYHDVTKV